MIEDSVDKLSGNGDVDDSLLELEKVLNLLYRDQARDDAAEVMQVIGQLGGDKSRYSRERRRAVRHLVSEIYSPPRVTAAATMVAVATAALAAAG